MIVDLRSDTVTRPTPAMREAIARAEVGDDVFGDDPTVNRLQAAMAERTGKEAALFLPTGTQSNLAGLMAHCERGDEYIVGQDAHTYKFEGGGAAVLGSIQPQPIEFDADGSLDLDRVAAAIKPDDAHFARTRLLCLENTQGGKVLPMEYLRRAHDFACARGLGLHLDGARLFNAAVARAVPVCEIAQHFDTVSVCLSKGLGAPVGSVLCGSHIHIGKARRWRKVLGGGMRQSGVLAAAGIYALEHHVERLADDHRNAKRLAQGLSRIDGVDVDAGAVQTNMTFMHVAPDQADTLREWLAGHGMRIGSGNAVRLVTHLDVDAEDIERVVQVIGEFFATSRRPAASLH